MRTYSVTMNGVSISTAITILQIKAGAANGLRLLRASCAQTGLTSSAMQAIEIVRKTAAATVTSFTPLLWTPDDSAAKAVGGTSATGTNASAEGTDGNVLLLDAFNVLNGWLWVPTPEERIFVPGGGIIGMKFPAAPSAMTVYADLVFGED